MKELVNKVSEKEIADILMMQWATHHPYLFTIIKVAEPYLFVIIAVVGINILNGIFRGGSKRS